MARTKAANSTESVPTTTKWVHNRNIFKVELVVNGEVLSILPGKTVEVPDDYNVPTNLGLYITEH